MFFQSSKPSKTCWCGCVSNTLSRQAPLQFKYFLLSPVFIWMTKNQQIKDTKAKKNSHLFLPPASLSTTILDFLFICTISHISFFSSLSLSLSHTSKLLLKPFSQFPLSLQNYSPYLFRIVITICFCFCGWTGF